MEIINPKPDKIISGKKYIIFFIGQKKLSSSEINPKNWLLLTMGRCDTLWISIQLRAVSPVSEVNNGLISFEIIFFANIIQKSLCYEINIFSLYSFNESKIAFLRLFTFLFVEFKGLKIYLVFSVPTNIIQLVFLNRLLTWDSNNVPVTVWIWCVWHFGTLHFQTTTNFIYCYHLQF